MGNPTITSATGDSTGRYMTLMGSNINAASNVLSASDVEDRRDGAVASKTKSASSTTWVIDWGVMGSYKIGDTIFISAHWDGGSSTSFSVVVTSSLPSIATATYDPSTGNLIISGSNLGTDSIDPTKLTITGETNGSPASYTLSGSVVAASNGTVTFTVPTNDRATVAALLDKTGTSALSSGTFTLTPSSSSWDSSNAGATTAATITVSSSGTPTLSHVGTQAPTVSTAGGSSVAIDNGTITVADQPDNGGNGYWNGGTLVVQIGVTNADTSNDTLSIASTAGIAASGNTAGSAVSYNTTLIGTIGSSTGVPGSALQINLNGSATDAAVQALVSAISFSDSAATTAGARTVSFTLTDAYGKSSTALSDTVNVSAGPGVSSIQNDNNTSTHLVSAATETFTVTFSQAVAGVSVSDFNVIAGAGVTGNATITITRGNAGTSANNYQGSSTYTVNISGLSGNGTVGLGLLAGADDGSNGASTVTAVSGSAALTGGAYTSGQTYTLDTIAPTVSVAAVTEPNTANVTTAQSSKAGTLYLVSSTVTVSNAASLVAAATASTTAAAAGMAGTAMSAIVSSINTNTTISTAGLGDGTYHVYAVDAAGNVSAASTNAVILDSTAPLLNSATVNGNQLVLTYTEAVSGIASSGVPVAGEYSVTTGSGSDTVTAVALDAVNKTVTLTLGTAAAVGDNAVTVSYTANGTSAQELQNGAGVLAANLTSQEVINNTAAPAPPAPPAPTTEVIPTDPVQQTNTAAYIGSLINSSATSITVAPPVASLANYQADVAAAAAAAAASAASGKTITVALPSAQVVALPQNTLQDAANTGYTSALQTAHDVVIATATAPSLSSFTSTVSSIAAYAAGSTVVLPQAASVAVSPTDLSNSAYVTALQTSGDTNLTESLSSANSSGAATPPAVAGTYSVLSGFTQTFSGGAKGNVYQLGDQSNLGVTSPTVAAGATASSSASGQSAASNGTPASQTLTLQSQTAAAATAATTAATPTGPSSGFQQIYTVQVQGFSSDYTITGYFGAEVLTSKSSGRAMIINNPQPLAGANNGGIDVQFLDGSVSITGNTAYNGVWTEWVTRGVPAGGDTSAWYNSSAQPVPASGSGQSLDLGSAVVQNNLLDSADNSQMVGFYGGTSLGLLPSTVVTINNSTPNAILTGLLGGGNYSSATFISGDSIALNGGNTTLNLFDFSGGTALPANTTVSGVNTLNLASRGSIGSTGSADNFSAWSGLTTLNATASGTGVGANGLINVTASNSTAVNLTANDTYSTTTSTTNNSLSSPVVGAITLNGGSAITITQNLSATGTGASAISGGGITVNGGSATSSVTVTQTAAVSGKVADGAVILNDVSANSSSLAGSLSTVVLNNYGQGSVINDNAIRFLTLSGTGGTLTINDSNTGSSTTNSSASVPITTLYLTLTGLSAAGDDTVTDLNAEITTLNIITAGTVNSTLNGFVDSHLTSISVQGTSALTLLNPSASLTSYTVTGSTAALTVAGHSDAAAANLTLSGAVTYTGSADAVGTGITLTAGSDNSNVSFATTGALSGSNSDSFTLGNGNNTISDIVAAGSSNSSTTNITVGTGSNQISTGSNTVNITLGTHAAGTIDSISVGVNASGNLSMITTITGAQAGDIISIADATQFIGAGVTAVNLTATGGNATTATLAVWVNAALSAQGANLQSHGETWFNFAGNTYLIEQAGSQGSAFAAGDTLVKLVGTLNESAAVLNGHAVTL
jgi:hypothetical protein